MEVVRSEGMLTSDELSSHEVVPYSSNTRAMQRQEPGIEKTLLDSTALRPRNGDERVLDLIRLDALTQYDSSL